jgi:hypothetical protein
MFRAKIQLLSNVDRFFSIMNTESTEQTPWYSRKGLFLLVGTITLAVSVFGYVWSQLWIAVGLHLIDADGLSNRLFGAMGFKDASDPYKAFSEAIIYNALSAGGIVIGIILIAYGLIPKRQSG